MSTTEWRAKDRRACDRGGFFGGSLGETRRAAWLIAAAFSAGNQIFCDDSFFKIDKMVDALLLFFRRAKKIRAAPLSSEFHR